MSAPPRPSFDRFAGACAILVGIGGFLYSVAFVIVARTDPRTGAFLSALFLLVGPLLATAALVGLYGRVRDVAPSFALWALLLAVAGSIGSAVHGGFDLANFLRPPTTPVELNPIDPRGLLTFGVTGLALFLLAWLIARGGTLPRGLAYLGYLSAALLVLIYLARLIIFDPSSPLVLVPAALEGFVVNPVWYVWLGVVLRRGAPALR